MNKKCIKHLLLFLIVLFVIVGITSVSATDNNTNTQHETQNSITDDTTQHTIQNNNIKESKIVENNKENSILAVSMDSYYVDLGEKPIIDGYLYTPTGTPISNQEVILQIDETAKVTTDEKGQFTYESSIKDLGFHDVMATFKGNDKYLPAEDQITFEVVNRQKSILKILSVTPANGADKITLDGEVFVRALLTDEDGIGLNDKTIFFNDDYAVVSNGISEFNTQIYYVGNNTLTVFFREDEKYKSSNDTITFMAEKDTQYIRISLDKDTVMVGDAINLSINAFENSTVRIKINNKIMETIRFDDDTFYDFKYTTSNDELGKNNISVETDGNDYYNPTVSTATFTVINTEIKLDEIPTLKVGENVTIYGTLYSLDGVITNANLTVDIFGEVFPTVTNEDGRFSVDYTSEDYGSIPFDVYFNGYGDYTPSHVFNIINVEPDSIEPDITEPNIIILDDIDLEFKEQDIKKHDAIKNVVKTGDIITKNIHTTDRNEIFDDKNNSKPYEDVKNDSSKNDDDNMPVQENVSSPTNAINNNGIFVIIEVLCCLTAFAFIYRRR